MNHYPQSEYPNLYEEILKDYHHRWGKFQVIPYPLAHDNNNKRINQKRNPPTLKTPPVWNPNLQRTI